MKTHLLKNLAFVLGLALALSAPVVAQDDLEDSSGPGITTAETYEYVPSETLPPVEGTSNYKWEGTVVFPINLWVGWAPIIMANGGLEPSEESVFFQKYGFKVKLVIVDDPIKARDGFAAGEYHILWGTLDMMALFAPQLAQDSRTSLRIFQQVDWSNGGDGVVARGDINSINDLRPDADGNLKSVALAESSPSHYFLLNLLYYAGISPDEVNMMFTGDAFQAAKAFVSDDQVDACVSWAPDIYTISDPEQSGIADAKLIASTAQAKRIIADVWAARADFARDHRDILKGLVQGIFDGMSLCKEDWESAAALFDASFGLPEGVANEMALDAHLTNFTENFDFFCDRNNPSNFESTWDNINNIYHLAGYIAEPVPFDQVVDNTILMDLREAYTADAAHNTDEYANAPPAPKLNRNIEEDGQEIVSRAVYLHFAANKFNVDYDYDPANEQVVKEIALMADQFGDAVIVITGHADRSKYDEAMAVGEAYFKSHAARVKRLSENRARGVLSALYEKYPKFKDQEGKFFTNGSGWDEPLDTDAKSRRVEIQILTMEE